MLTFLRRLCLAAATLGTLCSPAFAASPSTPVLFNSLLLSGKLYPHLLEIEQTAQNRLTRLMQQLTAAQGVNESLKAKDPMQWTGRMNNCKAQAEEMILTELIYS